MNTLGRIGMVLGLCLGFGCQREHQVSQAQPTLAASGGAPVAELNWDSPLRNRAVWAQWQENGWFHGKIVAPCAAGFDVHFDDGDRKCCAVSEITVDRLPNKAELKVQTPVLGRWKDGGYYPGVIKALDGDAYAVAFDDGDNATLRQEELRVRVAVGADFKP